MAVLPLAMAIRLITLTVFVACAVANLQYPLNQQLPPIARVGEPYSFQFAPTTFSAPSGGLSYSLSKNPAWISLDTKTGKLYGTPRAHDAGVISFTITATDSGGATATMNSTLIVSKDKGPVLQGNISQDLSEAGPLSGPQTVTFKPSTSFSITFSSDIFNTSGDELSYFATLSDHTPLPAWIGFDEPSLRFEGMTPASDVPLTFNVSLIASDTPGYASASLMLTMAISSHELVFSSLSQDINSTRGGDIHIMGLKSMLRLDQSPISDRNIKSATADLPHWLKFDTKTFDIVGTAPYEASSRDLTVTATDTYGDTAEHIVHLSFTPRLFASDLGDMEIIIGQPFEMRLPQTILAGEKEKVTLDFGALSNDLKFDSDTLTISGTVPNSANPQTVECSLIATSENGMSKDIQIFKVKLRAGDISNDSNSNHSSDGDIFSNKPKEKAQKAGLIVGIVIAALFVVLVLFAFFFCLFHKRSQAKGRLSPTPSKSPKSPRSPKKSEISRPTFIPIGWPHTNPYENYDLEKGSDDHGSSHQTLDRPPKLDWSMAASRRDRLTVGDSINDGERMMLDSFEKSSYGHIHDGSVPSDRPSGSMRIPTENAKRSSQNLANAFRKHKRRATTVYRDQIHRSTGLPVNRRITGMVSKPPAIPLWGHSNSTGDSKPRPLPIHKLTELSSGTWTPHPFPIQEHQAFFGSPSIELELLLPSNQSVYSAHSIPSTANGSISETKSHHANRRPAQYTGGFIFYP